MGRIALVLIGVLTLAACGTGIESPKAQPTPTASVPGASPFSTPSSPPSPAKGLTPPTETREITVTRDVARPPIVKGVRFGAHAGFDRVVIDLDGVVPGYAVRWVDEVVQDGSGERMDVQGGAYLQVTLTPANAHTEEGTPTWSGGPVYHTGLTNVRDVVRNGDFEAVVSVALVLDHRAGFRVLEQRGPSRLVIDVAH